MIVDESGLSTIEYVVIFILVAIVGIVTWQLFGESVSETVDDAQSEISTMGQEQGQGVGGAGANGAGGGGGTRVNMGGGGGSGSHDVEAVGDSHGDPTSDPIVAGGDAPDPAGTMTGGNSTGVVGVVRHQNEGMTVYEAPGTEEEDGNGLLILIVLLVGVMLVGGFFLFKRVRAAG